MVTAGKPFNARGVVVPLVTPFTDDGSIDAIATRRLIDRALDGGIQSFLLLGTTGEAASISADDKKRFVEIAVEHIGGRAYTYTGLANNSFRETILAARAYKQLGVDAVVGHLPNYYPLSGEQMHNWFVRLADAVDLPLFIYNIPMTTKMSVPVDVVQTLARHPNIHGMKDSEYDVARMEALLAYRRDVEDFKYFVGPSVMSLRGLQLGADGFVPGVGNVVPAACQRLMDAALANDWSAAEAAQDEMKRVGDTYMPNRSVGDAIAILKAVLAELGLCGSTVLPPLTRPTAADRAIIQSTVNALAGTPVLPVAR